MSHFNETRSKSSYCAKLLLSTISWRVDARMALHLHRLFCAVRALTPSRRACQQRSWTTSSSSQGGGGRCVVFASETGSRRSSETASFLTSLAHAKARALPAEMRGNTEAAWRRMWASMLSCAAARAYALCLLDLRASPTADGDVPNVHEVVGDHVTTEGP